MQTLFARDSFEPFTREQAVIVLTHMYDHVRREDHAITLGCWRILKYCMRLLREEL